MLSLPVDQPVLLLGDALDGWDEEFSDVRRASSLPVVGSEALIIADNIGAHSRSELRLRLRGAKKALAGDGYLLFLSHNFWSIPTLARAVTSEPSHKGKLESGWGAPGGPTWTPRALARAGFPVVDSYLCTPSLYDPGELVKPESPFLEISGNLHPLYQLSHEMGFLRRVHPHHFFICGSRDWQDGELVRGVRRTVSEFGGAGGPEAVRVGRFDIRQRGAIALFLSDERSGNGCIGRLVSGGPRSEPTERNHAFLQALHRSDRLSAWCRERMPREVGIVEGDKGRRVYVETLLPGTLAWKAPWDRLRTRIQDSSVDFLRRFGDSFARTVSIDEAVLEELLADEVAHVRGSAILSSEFRDRLLALLREVPKRLRQTELPLVCGHGDFGIGNVLVDPDTGAVTGVIDWDTGRECELPGVDRLNWEIQRIRKEAGVGFGDALRRLGSEPGGAGTEDTDWFHPIRGPVPESVRATLVMATGLRYVCRALRFPELFDGQEADFNEGLEYLESI